MNTVKKSFIYFGIYTIVLGLLYPAVVTGLAGIFFNYQANGSPVTSDGIYVGSKLIGQEFKEKRYFWGRPSATSPNAYNSRSSTGSNMALTNPALQKAITERISALENTELKVPVDLVSASASGLDPEISIAAAKFQVKRLALARGINADRIVSLIDRLAERKQIGIIGEPRVNVLFLNMELDKL